MGTEGEAEIISLLKDLQKRMVYLEKKIDLLASPSPERPSRGKSYPSASRSYGKPQSYHEAGEGRFGAKGARPGRSFEDRRSEAGRGFPKGKKMFSPAGKKPFYIGRGKHSDKPRGGR